MGDANQEIIPTWMPRLGGWMVTASGRQVWPLDPRPDDFTIEDIAHGLSHICRYGGHCRTFYSVAQHSVLVSQIVEGSTATAPTPTRFGPPNERAIRRAALMGLLHDASEAYIGDVVTPLKRGLTEYQTIERRMMSAIFVQFGFLIGDWESDAIKRADRTALITERRDLLTTPFPHGSTWAGDVAGETPWPVNIHPQAPEHARALFLERYAELSS